MIRLFGIRRLRVRRFEHYFNLLIYKMATVEYNNNKDTQGIVIGGVT